MKLKPSPHRLTLGVLAGLTGFGLGGQASAAGFALRNQSTSGLGTGLASDTVNSYDASGIFANPAVMSSMKGQNFSLGFDFIDANIKVSDATRSNTNPLTGERTPNPVNQGRTTVDTVSDPVMVPAVFGVHQINDTIHVGWGVTVPWATNTKYDEDWTGRYYSTKTELVVREITLAGSYHVSEMLDLGLSVIYQMAEGKLNSAVDLGLNAATINPVYLPNVGKADALSKFSADSTGVGFQLGAIARPTPELKVGLSLRTAVKHAAKGDLKFTPTNGSAAAFLTAAQGNAATAARVSDASDAKLDLTIPAVYALGAAYTMDAFTYYANATLTAWKTFDAFTIKYNEVQSTTKLDWKNSLYLALGADYRLDPKLTLRWGLSRDQGVTTDATRTPRTPDNDRTGLTIGAGYQVTTSVKVNAAYQRLILKDTKVDLSDTDYPDAAGRGNLTASYDIKPQLFMASLDVSL